MIAGIYVPVNGKLLVIFGSFLIFLIKI